MVNIHVTILTFIIMCTFNINFLSSGRQSIIFRSLSSSHLHSNLFSRSVEYSASPGGHVETVKLKYSTSF